MAQITGDDDVNVLSGTEEADDIDGRAGGDDISGNGGDDALYGGDDSVALLKEPNTGTGPLQVLAGNADVVRGGDGADEIDGGSGNDELRGDDGDDVIRGGDDGVSIAPSGRVDETAPDGFTEAGGRLFLSNHDRMFGGGGDDQLDGGPGNDTLFGDDGDDTLLGGADGELSVTNDDFLDGGAGSDFMAGGSGDDQYFVDSTFDSIVENAGEGNLDVVFAAAEITLAAHVEQLHLLDEPDVLFARGNAQANLIVGNSNANLLEGGDGNDELGGRGGNDILDGGAGDDMLAGDDGDDTYILAAGGGNDTVQNLGGGHDTVLASELELADVTFWTNGSDVAISINATGEYLTLERWLEDPAERVREVRFSDAVLDEAAIEAEAQQHTIDAANDFAAALEDASTSGDLLQNDSSNSGSIAVADTGTQIGFYGTLILAADGTFTYTADTAHFLAQDEPAVDFFDYEIVDEAGARDVGTLEVAITGLNDAPEFLDQADAQVTEDEPIVEDSETDAGLQNGDFETSDFSGWRVEGDAEFTGVFFGAESNEGYFGAVGAPTVLSQELATSEGSEYVVRFAVRGGADSDASFAASWNGEVLTALDDVTVDGFTTYEFVVDGRDGLSRLEFSLRNDSAFWYLDNVQVNERVHSEFIPESQTAAGTLQFIDVDVSDAHMVDVVPHSDYELGEFTASILEDSTDSGLGSVSWNFEISNEALQELAQGETLVQSYDVIVTDPYGVAATQTVAVTIVGTNDAPVAQDDTAAVREDAVVRADGNVLANDTDADAGATLEVEPGTFTGTYGTLNLARDGTYRYTLANTSLAVQSLSAGQEVSDVFTYEVTDDIATSEGTLEVTVTGANDAPTVANAIADQNARSGTRFSFTFAENTFDDIDQLDTLDYSASGMPAWLSFDAETRTFSGDATGSGTFVIRVQATDGIASATDEFRLTVGDGNQGQVIIGTNGNDVLVGTSGNDVIDGRKGYDVMSGGAGDDVYYVDMTCTPKGKGKGHQHHDDDDDGHDDHRGQGHDRDCKVDLVIEQPGEGYDIVYASADYTLPANVEEVRLLGRADLDATGNAMDNVLVGNSGGNQLSGAAGDDLLAGGRGDDRLKGGAGADVYLHELRGGDDVIEEQGSDTDTLLFGEGINARMARLERRRDDLVVDLAGPHGSVTVKGWFASSSKRVERIQFADGTSWDVREIRERVGRNDDWHCELPRHDRDDRHHSHHGRDDRDGRNDGPRHDLDLDKLLGALDRPGAALTKQQIAGGWRAVARYVQTLSTDDGAGEGGGTYIPGASLLPQAQMRFGYEGSTGAPRGQDVLRALEGLAEGFRRL